MLVGLKGFSLTAVASLWPVFQKRLPDGLILFDLLCLPLFSRDSQITDVCRGLRHRKISERSLPETALPRLSSSEKQEHVMFFLTNDLLWLCCDSPMVSLIFVFSVWLWSSLLLQEVRVCSSEHIKDGTGWAQEFITEIYSSISFLPLPSPVILCNYFTLK